MIARIWHGRTSSAKADAYVAFIHQRAIPDYQAVAGNRGAYILRRTEGDVTHIITLTFWESVEAIRAFAGPIIETAKYYPEDADFLLEFEPTVTHYEVSDGFSAKL